MAFNIFLHQMRREKSEKTQGEGRMERGEYGWNIPQFYQENQKQFVEQVVE